MSSNEAHSITGVAGRQETDWLKTPPTINCDAPPDAVMISISLLGLSPFIDFRG